MRIRIGDLLVKAGVITDAQLKQALAEQHQWGGKLGDILVRMEFVTEEVLVRALSKQSGIPRADLVGEAPKGALEKVPPEVAEEFGLVPLALQDEGRTLVVAMSDPLNIMVTDHLRSITGCRIVAQIAGTASIRNAISRWYRGEALGNDADLASIRIVNNAGGNVVVTGSAPPPSAATSRGASKPVTAPTSAGSNKPATIPSGPPRPVSMGGSSSGLRAVPPSMGPAPSATATSLGAIPNAAIAASLTATSPGGMAQQAAGSPSAVEVLRGVEETQRRSVAALKAMVELLIEKGVFSRDEYLKRVKR